MSFKQNFFPLNDASQDPNVRGESPRGLELHEDVAVGAMVAGVKTVDVDSVFGKGLGEVTGVILLDTEDTGNANQVVSASVAASATAGKVTVTFQSTDATSTTNLIKSFFLVGVAYPINA